MSNEATRGVQAAILRINEAHAEGTGYRRFGFTQRRS
jgi:hypothetical protein